MSKNINKSIPQPIQTHRLHINEGCGVNAVNCNIIAIFMLIFLEPRLGFLYLPIKLATVEMRFVKQDIFYHANLCNLLVTKAIEGDFRAILVNTTIYTF